MAREHGGSVHVFPADLADREAAEAAVAGAVAALGGLDVLVSNAGAVAFGHFLEVAGRRLRPHRPGHVHGRGQRGPRRAAGAARDARHARGHLVDHGADAAAGLLVLHRGQARAARVPERGPVEEREQRTGVRVALVAPGRPTRRSTPGRRARRAARRRFSPTPTTPTRSPGPRRRPPSSPRHDRIVGGESKLVDAAYRHRAARAASCCCLRRPLVPDRRRSGRLARAACGPRSTDARVGGGPPGSAERRRARARPQPRRGAARARLAHAAALLRPVPESAAGPGDRPRPTGSAPRTVAGRIVAPGRGRGAGWGRRGRGLCRDPLTWIEVMELLG